MRESANGKAKVGAKPAVGGATVAVVASKKGAGAEGDKAGKDKPRVVIVHRPVPIAVPRSKADVKAAGAPAPPAPAAPPPPPPPGKPQDAATGAAAGAAGGDGEMRIITFYGDWMCFCNKVNRLWDTCVCGQIPPCRDWVRGRCTYKDRCRFSHPPFELPDNLPRPKSPIAKPGPDAVVYKKSRNPAAAAAAAARHAVAVITPEVKPVAAPKTVAATAAAPAPPAKPAAAVAPPPLKPAPWAGVKPGAAIQPPAAPPAVYSSSRAAVAPGGPPPPPPPRQPVAEADSGHSSGFGLPESLAEPAAPPSSAGFDIFGSNPLVHVLDSQPHAAQQQHPVSSAFSALSLGSSLGTAPQAGAPPTVQLFGPGGGLGGSFLGGTPTDGSVPAASVTFQPGGFHNGPAPGAMPPLNQQYGGGLGGLSGSLGNGNGLHGSLGQELRGSVLGLGSGGDFGGDDWGDLQLQLPSDLGEILGADPVPAQHAVPPQQMVLGTDLYGSGANGNGHPPGWGAL